MKKRIQETKMRFEGIDYRWALVYLALTTTNKDRVDNKLQGILPRRKRKQGDPPTVKTAHIDESLERWWYPTDPAKLTQDQKKSVMSCVVEQMVRVVFSTHYYEWEGNLYQQIFGGPIGLRATGPVARIMMDWWTRQIREIEEKSQILAKLNPVQFEPLQLYMLRKYVDDCLVVMEEMKLGVRWSQDEGAFIWDKASEEEDRRNNVDP